MSVTAQGLGGTASVGEEFLKALKDDDVNKALELANQPGARVVTYRGYSGESALHIVTRNRELPWISFLLNRGADPNMADSKGDTALIIASSAGFDDGAALLLRRGAKVDATNRRGETALTAAVQQRQTRIVELLLQAGANPDKADHVTGYSPRDYAKRDTRNPQILKLIENTKSTKKQSVAGPSIN
jgi:ankyrin repeat protein